MKHFLLFTLFSAFIFLAACGRSNTVYVDTNGNAVVGTDGRSGLPTGFANQSVHDAVADAKSGVARLRLATGTVSGGTFNDSTLSGNRAILGLSNYDEKLLKDVALSVTTSAAGLRVSLLVDLKCDSSSIRTVETSELISGGGTVSLSDAVWTAPGGVINDSSGTSVLDQASASSLDALVSAYPLACLRGAKSDAPDAPSNIPVASVLFSIGSGTSTGVSELDISSITVFGDTFNTWGT